MRAKQDDRIPKTCKECREWRQNNAFGWDGRHCNPRCYWQQYGEWENAIYELACLSIPPGERFEDADHVEHRKYWVDGGLFMAVCDDFAHYGSRTELLAAIEVVRDVLVESVGDWIEDPAENPLPELMDSDV